MTFRIWFARIPDDLFMPHLHAKRSDGKYCVSAGRQSNFRFCLFAVSVRRAAPQTWCSSHCIVQWPALLLCGRRAFDKFRDLIFTFSLVPHPRCRWVFTIPLPARNAFNRREIFVSLEWVKRTTKYLRMLDVNSRWHQYPYLQRTHHFKMPSSARCSPNNHRKCKHMERIERGKCNQKRSAAKCIWCREHMTRSPPHLIDVSTPNLIFPFRAHAPKIPFLSAGWPIALDSSMRECCVPSQLHVCSFRSNMPLHIAEGTVIVVAFQFVCRQQTFALSFCRLRISRQLAAYTVWCLLNNPCHFQSGRWRNGFNHYG